ncbi:hypothetical protein ACVMDO_000684, partial [Bradyrhizobium sp. USDA 4513]
MFQNRFGAVARLAELGCVLAALTLAAATAARADGCPKPSDEIATDRPDVTN